MTLSKDALIGFLVLVVALGALAWYLSDKPASLPDLIPGEETPAPWSDSPEKVTENAKYYDIEARYPSSTPLAATAGTEADAAAVAVMRAWIEATMQEFKANGGFETLTPEDIAMLGYDQGRKQELGIEYEVKQDAHTVSFVYAIYSDTMGAHPNTFIRTFMFDRKTGAELSLSSIFAPGSGYLVTLSTKARAILAPHIAEASAIPLEEFDRTYLESGTEPVSDNFQWFYFEEDALVLLFPAYQVGPYVIGPQEVRIPKTELSTILRSEYQ